MPTRTMMQLLRFDWRPTQVRLMLAAMADPGPVSKGDWAIRSGVPRNHLLSTLAECERLGGLKSEGFPEGLTLFLQPPEFWRVTPLVEPRTWEQVWGRTLQARLPIVSETMSLAESMSMTIRESHPTMSETPPESGDEADRNPENLPPMIRTMIPKHGLNMDHDHGQRNRNPEKPKGSRAESLLTEHLLPEVTSEKFREQWTRRLQERPDLVEFAIEEAILPRRRDGGRMSRATNVVAFANHVYLREIGRVTT